MLKTELKIPFVWYNNITKQHRMRPQHRSMQPWGLPCPNNTLLPFEIKRPAPVSPDTITSWKIYKTDGVEVADITASVTDIEVADTATDEYLVYKGNTSLFTLANGFYYSILVKGINTYTSEVFQVFDDLTEFVKLEWYNNADIAPLLYQTGFKNVIYLETYTEAITPNLTEEGDNNGVGDFLPNLQRIIHKHKIEILVPDYLQDALSMLPMHDVVNITEGIDTVEMLEIKVTAEYADNYLGTCKVEFELPGDYIKTACAKNLILL